MFVLSESSEKIIPQLFVSLSSNLSAGLLRLCCKTDNVMLCFVAFICIKYVTKQSLSKQRVLNITVCYCCVSEVFSLGTGSLWLHTGTTWVSLWRATLFITHRELLTTGVWTWKINLKASCILPLTQLKCSLLCGLKSIEARVSLGNVMGAWIYSQRSEHCFHLTLRQSQKRGSEPFT